MTLARCPACHTTFRIPPEQLELRGGRVRCGQCLRPFNALEHLLPTDEPTSPSTPPSPPPAAPAPSVASHMTSSGLDETPVDDNFTLQPPDLGFLQAVVDAQRRKDSPASTDEAPQERPPGDFDYFDLDSFHTGITTPGDLPHGGDRAENSAPPPVATEEAVLPEVFHHRRDEPATQPSVPENADEAEEFTRDDVERPEVTEPETTDEESESLEAWRDEAYRRTPPREPQRGLWALGVGVLLGALVAQAGYLYREPLTRAIPQLRPVYLAVCAQLDCKVPLPRVADALAIAASRLEPQAGVEYGYRLFAEIANSARHPQEYPYLELTLRDKNDQLLARRAFPPQEWVPDDRDVSNGIPAQGRFEITLPFSTDPRAEPMGYRIRLFYP